MAGGGTSHERSPSWVLVASTNGPGGGVAHDRDRRRVDVQPLEQVEVHAERVGQHRLDQVAVADRDPDGPGAVLGLDRRVPAAYGVHDAGLHRRQRLAAGERGGGRLGLHDLPERLLGQLLQRPALPLAVVALGQAPVGGHPQGRRVWARTTAWAVCRQRSSGLETTAASGTARQPGRGALGLRHAGVVEADAGRPAGQHAADVGRGPSVPDEDHRCHVGEASRTSAGRIRDRRQRRLPQGRARPRRPARPTTTPRCWPPPASSTTSSGSGWPIPPRRSSPTSPRPSGCTRWPSRTRSTPTSGPSSTATTTACSSPCAPSGTSTSTTPSRPARSTCSSGTTTS